MRSSEKDSVNDLEFRIDRNPRIQLALHQRQRSLGEFAQPIGVGLGAFIRAAHQQARVAEQAAVEPGADFQKGVLQIQLALAGRGRLDLAPGIGAGELCARSAASVPLRSCWSARQSLSKASSSLRRTLMPFCKLLSGACTMRSSAGLSVPN